MWSELSFRAKTPIESTTSQITSSTPTKCQVRLNAISLIALLGRARYNTELNPKSLSFNRKLKHSIEKTIPFRRSSKKYTTLKKTILPDKTFILFQYYKEYD